MFNKVYDLLVETGQEMQGPDVSPEENIVGELILDLAKFVNLMQDKTVLENKLEEIKARF